MEDARRHEERILEEARQREEHITSTNDRTLRLIIEAQQTTIRMLLEGQENALEAQRRSLAEEYEKAHRKTLVSKRGTTTLTEVRKQLAAADTKAIQDPLAKELAYVEHEQLTASTDGKRASEGSLSHTTVLQATAFHRHCTASVSKAAESVRVRVLHAVHGIHRRQTRQRGRVL